MTRIIIATRNTGKLREIQSLLGASFDIISVPSLDDSLQIDEDAETFEGNALKKAAVTASHFGAPCLADDSGLDVDFLGGKPGVHSARFGGSGLTDAKRCDLLLDHLKDAPQSSRSARFRAVLAYIEPGTQPSFFQGTLEGRIAFQKSGEEGFGYDPIFIPEGFDKTLAALGPSVKNTVSHRAKALAAFAAFLKAKIEQTVPTE